MGEVIVVSKRKTPGGRGHGMRTMTLFIAMFVHYETAFSETQDQTMALDDAMGPRPITSRERPEAFKRLWQDTVHCRL